MNDEIKVSQASPKDLDELLALLTTVGLPHEGVAEYLDGFLVARDAEGRLIACAGLERHGLVGLLRSVAVTPGLQRTGFGSRLTSVLLDRAASDGLSEAVLLTTTARDFFARRFGFKEANRADYNEKLAPSPEWQMPCCSSAVFMTLNLQEHKWKEK